MGRTPRVRLVAPLFRALCLLGERVFGLFFPVVQEAARCFRSASRRSRPTSVGLCAYVLRGRGARRQVRVGRIVTGGCAQHLRPAGSAGLVGVGVQTSQLASTMGLRPSVTGLIAPLLVPFPVCPILRPGLSSRCLPQIPPALGQFFLPPSAVPGLPVLCFRVRVCISVSLAPVRGSLRPIRLRDLSSAQRCRSLRGFLHLFEPPRESRRLHLLSLWEEKADDFTDKILPGSPGAGSAPGAGSPG